MSNIIEPDYSLDTLIAVAQNSSATSIPSTLALAQPVGTEADRKVLHAYLAEFKSLHNAMLEHNVHSVEREEIEARQAFEAETTPENLKKLGDLIANRPQRRQAVLVKMTAITEAQKKLTRDLLKSGALHRVAGVAKSQMQAEIMQRISAGRKECAKFNATYIPCGVVAGFAKSQAGLEGMLANVERHQDSAQEIVRMLLTIS